MSYDLMVFKKEAAPKTRSEFMIWYQNQTEWAEEHSYDDPINTSIELRHWFMDMIKTFPAMNGPFAVDDEDNDMITGYSIGKDSIYVDFRWSVAEQAYSKVLELAIKHSVGFFDVSSDEGDILFPENGELKAIDKPERNNKPDSGGEDSYTYYVETIEKNGSEIIKNITEYNVKIEEKPARYRPWWKFW